MELLYLEYEPKTNQLSRKKKRGQRCFVDPTRQAGFKGEPVRLEPDNTSGCRPVNELTF